MTLPLCKEVCQVCVDGRHVFHVLNELGDLSAYVEKRLISGKESEIIKFEGWAESELWVEDLMRVISLEYSRMEVK